MQPDFGNLYKFIASIGIVMIIAAFFFPYAVYNQNIETCNSLLLSNSTLKVTRQICEIRFNVFLLAHKIAFVLAVIILLLGIIVLFLGGRTWKKHQAKLDEKLAAEIVQLRPATQVEIIEKALSEAEGSEQDQLSDTDSSAGSAEWYSAKRLDLVTEVKLVEEYLYSVLKQKLSKYYSLEQEVMLGRNFIDLVLRARGEVSKDILIEVKYIRKSFRRAWLDTIQDKLINALAQYQRKIKPNSMASLIIVLEDNGTDSSQLLSLVNSANKNALRRSDLFSVIILSRSEIESYDFQSVYVKR